MNSAYLALVKDAGIYEGFPTVHRFHASATTISLAVALDFLSANKARGIKLLADRPNDSSVIDITEEEWNAILSGKLAEE